MAIEIDVEINRDGQLTGLKLPVNAPIGRIRLIIEPVDAQEGSAQSSTLTREEARAKLLAAGYLSTVNHAPPDAVRSGPEQIERLAKLFGGGPISTLDIINEDRGLKE